MAEQTPLPLDYYSPKRVKLFALHWQGSVAILALAAVALAGWLWHRNRDKQDQWMLTSSPGTTYIAVPSR